MNTIESTRNILIGVDIQNDFIDGSLAVPDGETVVAPTNLTAEAIRRFGGTAIFTRDWHPSSTPHFDTWPVHCVAGTDGAAFHPQLDVQPGDTIISKGMGQTDGYSGWDGVADDGTTIERIITPMRDEKVRVFIGGLATDYCVKATALDVMAAFADDNRVTTYLLRDAVRGVDLQPDDSEKALDAMRAAGVIEITSRNATKLIEGDAS